VAPPPPVAPAATSPISDHDALKKFEEVSARLPDRSRRDILVQVAAELGLPRSVVYAAVERAKLGS
jgi:hypothetical protein